MADDITQDPDVVSLFESMDPATALPQHPMEAVAESQAPGPPADTPGVDYRARIAALATTPDSGPTFLEDLRANTARMGEIIRAQGEASIRNEAAMRAREAEVAEIVDQLHNSKFRTDPDGSSTIYAAQAALNVVQGDIADREESAIEEAALDRIAQLAASGDDTQARIAIDLLRYKDSTVEMMRENEAKRMIIAREVMAMERDQQSQGWLMNLADFAMRMIPANYPVSHGGNVRLPDVMRRWYDGLLSGQRIQSEVASLYALPLPEFSRYVRDELLPNIRDNATLMGFYDKTEALELMRNFQDTPGVLETNIGDLFDNFGFVGPTEIGRAARITSLLVRGGARSAAATAVTEALARMASEGTAQAVKTTGIAVEEAVDAASVAAVAVDRGPSTISLAIDVAESRAKGEEALRQLLGNMPSTGRLTDAEQAAAIQKAENIVREQFGNGVRDVAVPETVTMSTGSRINRVVFTLGKPNGGLYHSEALAAKRAANLGFRPDDFTIVADESGGFGIRVTRDVSEVGFTTAPYVNGATNPFWRSLLGGQLSADELLQGVAQNAVDRKALLISKVIKPAQNIFRSLRGAEKEAVAAVLAKQRAEGVWYTNDHLFSLWHEAFGRAMTEREFQAVTTARYVEDIAYTLRDDAMVTDLVVSGHRQVAFDTGLRPFDGPAIVSEIPETFSTRIYDITTRTHIPEVTKEILERLKAEGYVLIRPKGGGIPLADGTTIAAFVGKRGSFEEGNIARGQVAYRAGGRTIYDPNYVTHFARQAIRGIQADTGKGFLSTPRTFIGGTKAEVQFWVDRMEAARQLYLREEGVTADVLDELFEGHPGLPTGEDFIRGMDGYVHEDGLWKVDYQKEFPFEVNGDRQMPTAYDDPDIDPHFIDFEEGGMNGWRSHAGRLYYSHKGTDLLNWIGNEAPILDAYSAINQSLMNVAQVSSFGDMKIEAVNRWLQSFKSMYDLPANVSPMRQFLEATAKPRPRDLRLFNIAEANRDHIKRILSWQTEVDRVANQENRRFQDWLLGEDPTSFRHSAAKASLHWWANSDPVAALRTFGSSLKLGFFNPAQFLLQVSTSVAATTISPRFGMQGMATYWFTRLYTAGSAIDYKALVRLGGFADEAEAKLYLESWRSSGFAEVNQHVLTDFAGPNAAMSATGNALADFNERGMFFFNEAERWNRVVAHRIAWGEAVEQFGKEAIGTNDFERFLSRRRHDYSWNMGTGSRSAWQTGILSIPTQFWGYAARMTEAMFGRTFTRAQRARLIVGQLALYGASGTGITAAIQQIGQIMGGSPSPDLKDGLRWDRGFLDHMIYFMTDGLTEEEGGLDISAGKRYGVGGSMVDIVREFFGASQYGPTSPFDFVAGASAGILGPVLGSLVDLARYSAAESGNGDRPLVGDAIIRLGSNISTVNNALKAMILMNYGTYLTSKGSTSVEDLPRWDALAVAMGFQPGEVDQLALMADYQRNRSKAIKEASRVIRNYRVRLGNEPDHRNEIIDDMNAFIRLLPDDIRAKVQKSAHEETPESTFEYYAQQIERERAEAELRQQVEERASGETN